tara:strand:+ start:260 stop:454 length:195 start_codon:yes stop_codon:yes gene_type:complete
VFSEPVNSRDTININIALKLQTVLDVELITQEKLMDASDGTYSLKVSEVHPSQISTEISEALYR